MIFNKTEKTFFLLKRPEFNDLRRFSIISTPQKSKYDGWVLDALFPTPPSGGSWQSLVFFFFCILSNKGVS